MEIKLGSHQSTETTKAVLTHSDHRGGKHLRQLRRAGLICLVSATIAIGYPAGVMASNWWNHYKYLLESITLNLYNVVHPEYVAYFDQEAWSDPDAWDPYTNLVLYRETVSSTEDGRIYGYTGYYGFTGWAGRAEVTSTWGGACGPSPTIILKGNARVNLTYTDSYSVDGRKRVVCQEVGHMFGLDHGFDDSCMNEIQQVFSHPSAHDRDMINFIYAGLCGP